MRVVALLSWYDEPPVWLVECVRSLAGFCDHVVAVDGPYALFPGAADRPASASDQAEAIAFAAAGVGLGCTIHMPRVPWAGGEVEKRDFMFRLASTFTGPDDWFLRIDADEYLGYAPWDARERLEAASEAVAEVTLRDLTSVPGYADTYWLRALFKALPGIGVQQAHYMVTAGDRVLCGMFDDESALQMHDLVIRHRHHERGEARKTAKASYYRVRDELGIENVY